MPSAPLSAALIALALLVPACDGGDTTTTAAPTTEATSEETPAGDATIAVAETSLGDVLVDADGLTVYLFGQDTGTESTCYDDCETNWPPVTVDGEPVAGEGVDASLLGTTERDDGSVQLTYNDHPLYLFGGDAAPGDVNGQAVGDVWYVVSPGGDAVDGAEAMTRASY